MTSEPGLKLSSDKSICPTHVHVKSNNDNFDIPPIIENETAPFYVQINAF